MKKTAFLTLFCLFLTQVDAPRPQAKEEILNKCLNTLDGRFERQGTRLHCKVIQPLDGSKKLKDKTGGLVEGGEAEIDFNMDLNLKFLKSLVLKKQLVFPAQFVNLKLLFKGGADMPVKLTLAPVVYLKGDLLSGNLEAHDASPNITQVRAKLLPGFMEKRLMKELNQDKALKSRMVRLTNGAFAQALSALGL